MNISIFGAGYVGLVTGVCLAEKLNKVFIYDIDNSKINNLKKGKINFYEKDLNQKLNKLIDKKIFFTSNFDTALLNSSIVIICVNTPNIGNRISLRSFKNSINSIGFYLKNNKKFLSIVVKSTVPPGTTISIKKILNQYNLVHCKDYGLGMNPEFLREGSAIYDFIKSDRIVIGYEDLKTKKNLTNIYSNWKTKKIYCNTSTAELIKYANNSLYATLISFSNQFSRLTNKLGNINLNTLMEGIITDKRLNVTIGDKNKTASIASYLIPGLGYGGSCFPKDLVAISNFAKQKGIKLSILDEVIKVNNSQIKTLFTIFKKNSQKLVNNKILILGLAFKENTDDMRNSVSIKLIEKLVKNKNIITVHDSLALSKFKKNNKYKDQVSIESNWIKSIKNNQIIIIMNADIAYKKINKLKIKNKIIYDNKSIITNKELKQNNKYLTL